MPLAMLKKIIESGIPFYNNHITKGQSQPEQSGLCSSPAHKSVITLVGHNLIGNQHL